MILNKKLFVTYCNVHAKITKKHLALKINSIKPISFDKNQLNYKLMKY